MGDRVPPRRRRTRDRPLAHPPLRDRPLPVPQVGSGQRRHPITLNEIKVPDGQAIIDLELKTFTEIKPDLSLELRFEQLKLTCDLLVEIDLTARPSYNREKFLAYDAFLCGWASPTPDTDPRAPVQPSCSYAPTTTPRSPARARRTRR